MLSLDIDGEHPFPWEEPICTETILPTRLTQVTLFIYIRIFNECIQLRGINLTLALSRSDRWKEEELSGILVRLAERRMSEAEMGQRIKTLMQYVRSPSSLSSILSIICIISEYWSIMDIS